MHSFFAPPLASWSTLVIQVDSSFEFPRVSLWLNGTQQVLSEALPWFIIDSPKRIYLDAMGEGVRIDDLVIEM